ncbi:protein phosphatase 2C domain-containing protein [Acidisoma cellulosilytica]|uniref:Protein phosphatase 2C domain-containing protein n=1 Tax=Acidisoma cellulosilyticum TaxID=2802395 RepID=A0A963Z7A4_9PROT|nr:PP2C family serine/threonine-protein phosphatase [Acidisoma cellulosilyticum]MCB8883826.1 protein phosphatase 2C domain-containing protein [Acidisoma cellulosilyticum]
MTSDRWWRTAFATSIGTSHEKTGSPCQDAADCRVVEDLNGEQILIAAVSDGAGTAAHSEIGSKQTVSEFLEHFSGVAQRDATLETITSTSVKRWFRSLVESLKDTATRNGHELRDYSCTILGAVLARTASIYVQLGDGAIVVATEGGDDYAWVFWPQNGEYANSTFFVTQPGVEELLQIEAEGPPVDEIAIFSDGIERLVLNMSERTVHGPAFQPIFSWLATLEEDQSGLPSPVLESYLASKHINSRTDDDKSLVMATRRLAAVPENVEAAV